MISSGTGTPGAAGESDGTGAAPDRGTTFGWVVLMVAAVIGVATRMWGLGQRPLAVDEYYFVVSAEAILEHGRPLLHGGGFYVRSLVPEYLTAAALALFGVAESSARLVPLLFGVAAPVLLFAYARRFVGDGLAAVCSALLLLSAWEVEFSRFARMYTPFQFATLLTVLTAERAFFEGRWHERYLPHAAVTIGILCHELSVVLLPLLFIPLAIPAIRSRFTTHGQAIRYALATGAIVGLFAFLHLLEWRTLGVAEALPDGVRGSGGVSLRTPSILLWSLSGSLERDFLIFVVGGVALGLAGAAAVRWRRGVTPCDVAWSLTVWAALAHQFTVMIGTGLVAAALWRRSAGPARRRCATGLAAAGLIAVLWAAYALLGIDWQSAHDVFWRRGIRLTFLSWPEFYRPVVLAWRNSVPVLAVLLAGALAVEAYRMRRASLRDVARHPAVPIVITLLFLGSVTTSFTSTRYGFHVYPLALLVVCMAARALVRRLATRVPPDWGGRLLRGETVVVGVLVLAAFAATEDLSVRHLSRVADPSVGLRTGEFERFEDHWYPRWDVRSPAEFLDGHPVREPGDPVIVNNLPAVSWYLASDHAVHFDRAGTRLLNVSRERGTLDAWSGARLLSSESDVGAYLGAASRGWIVQQIPEMSGRRTVEVPLPAGCWTSERVFLSTGDGRIEVLRLDRRTERLGCASGS